MKLRLPVALSRAGFPAALGPAAVLIVGLFAYRPLLLDALGAPALSGLEHWFFAPGDKAPLPALAIAGWLLWRRRARLVSLPPRSAPLTCAALLALGIGAFVWAQLVRAPELLLPSLAANLLAFAAACRGRPGCGAVALPAVVLLLGCPIPTPIRNELVWQLQHWSANGAAWLLHAAGVDVSRAGLQLRSGSYVFTVIESCSGLRGIEILTLVAVVVRELFASGGRRQWLLVLLAPGLGLALNVLRVAAVVVSAWGTDPGQGSGADDWDHTVQGLATLLAGTALLYGLGWRMAGSRRPSGAGPGRGDALPGADRRDADRRETAQELRWKAAGGLAVALAALSLLVPPLRVSQQMPPEMGIPERLSGWSGEDLDLGDDTFLGPLMRGYALHRRYEKPLRDQPPLIVDLFVGFDVAGHRASSLLFSPKLAVPGAHWSLEERSSARLWGLGVDADLGVASHDSQRALVYTWRLRDQGLWPETLRALLRLESGPFRREPPRAVVRLTTPLAFEGPVARDRAKRALERFIADFHDALAAL